MSWPKHWVYVARAEYSDYTKIGITTSPYVRLQQLQNPRGNPTGYQFHGLEYICRFTCETKSEARACEKKLHEWFNEWRLKGTEWFWLPESTAVALQLIVELHAGNTETEVQTNAA